MGFPNWGEGGGADLGKFPTFSRFCLEDVPNSCLLAARLVLNICNIVVACLFICCSFSVRHCNIVVTCGQTWHAALTGAVR